MIFECVVSIGPKTAVVPVIADDRDIAEDEALEIVENILEEFDIDDLIEAGEGTEHTLWFAHPLEDADEAYYDDDEDRDPLPQVISVLEITSPDDSQVEGLDQYYTTVLAAHKSAVAA